MTTKDVTIIYSNEGVSITWPKESTSRVFSNSNYLVESYAVAMQAKKDAWEQLVGPVAESLNTLDDILKDEGAPQAELSNLRQAIMDAATMLT